MKNYRFILMLLLVNLVFSQQEYILKGIVYDEHQQGLPFASISIYNSNKGTSANEKGEFEFKLKSGQYRLVVQYLGYKKQEVAVDLYQNQFIKIMMRPEEYTLKEISIKANEDPAYQVIRNAIKTRKKHLKELNSLSYQCDVYIKGVQKFENVPDKIMGMKVSIDEKDKGIFYLSETKSVFYFVPPDKKKEIIKASRVSGESKGFSFNRFIPMQKNIYENTLDFYFITNRPFISPISENALLFYKYRMQGTFYEGDKMINKIEVIPKSATEPCFRGFIYIEENTWRVHSFDFYITKESKLNFIDTLWLKQVNTRVQDSLFYPVSIQYLFNFNVFGIKGSGYFIASVSEYLFNIDSISPKFFKNEMVKFEKDAIKNDSDYWEKTRPVPLSIEEKKDYIKKDSIEKVRNSPKYLDSIDKRHNRFDILKIITGYSYQNSQKKFNFNIDGLQNAGVQYNTIEGINVTLNTSMSKKNQNETKKWTLQNAFRYGIANQLFGFKSKWKHEDNPFNFRYYGVSFQYYVEPFNHQYAISELVNTAYTLLDYRNYLKLYLRKAIDVFYHQEILNGLYCNITASAEERTALRNQYQLKIFQKENHFTSNDPLNPISDSLSFNTHQAFIIHLKLKYNIKQRYTTYPDQKYVWRNKYPVLSLDYIKAIPFNNSMVNYDLVTFKVNDNIDLKYFGDLKWEMNAGQFFNTQKMYFMDYYHFAGNQTIILNQWNSFRLLNYFNFSTNQNFIEAHTEYNLRGLLIGRLPFIKKFKLEEIITAHYLYNPLLNNYFEISFGLDKLFYIARVEYALAYFPQYQKPIGQILVGLNFLNRK